ncbi:MAG: asparagine synthase (glutamine-hydrolyzing) [Patescibacteria group bacterium]
MCGIAGFVCKKNQKPPSKLLARMVKAIRHRGSDDEGVYIKDNAALGHRRLSILDLSASGHQPMPDTSGKIWITFNGEIYNYLELKKELPGPWQSSSDTEVLLKGYKKWGKRTPEHLNGIFAFALWDEHKKELYAARDHLGVKPFYYAIQNGVFYFASEIKALLVAGIKTKPNDKIIYDYLAYGYYHHTNETFFENIHQLPAGCFLLYKNGKLKIERYWDLKDRVLDLSNWSGGKAAGDFFHVFKDAVCIQLRSDVPIGVQLSGGFDSSAVTAMVHHIVGGQKNFRLFSHVYSDHKDKEIPFMKALAKGLGWKWEYITVSPSDMSDLAEEVLWHQDEPFPGLPTFGLHMLAKVCRENKIPVILGGQGGDEVGAGYEYYMGAYFLDVLQNDGLDRMYDELNAYGMLR